MIRSFPEKPTAQENIKKISNAQAPPPPNPVPVSPSVPTAIPDDAPGRTSATQTVTTPAVASKEGNRISSGYRPPESTPFFEGKEIRPDDSPKLAMASTDWEKEIAESSLNITSEDAPSIFGLSLRWPLFAWGFFLSVYDISMFVTSFTKDSVPFLRSTFHYVFILTCLSGPALLYLMISTRLAFIWWKIHFSCQIFRFVMNVLLFFDYYCVWCDEMATIHDPVMVQVFNSSFEKRNV
uniref:Uncharacterized protein n=1 Tax=Panagrolaimus sp. JU765 TaxID=591449 RepID=A0AC34RLS3_9BILA